MKNIFYNIKLNEPKLKTKTQHHTIVPKTKISVDINKLLNRVRKEEKCICFGKNIRLHNYALFFTDKLRHWQKEYRIKKNKQQLYQNRRGFIKNLLLDAVCK